MAHFVLVEQRDHPGLLQYLYKEYRICTLLVPLFAFSLEANDYVPSISYNFRYVPCLLDWITTNKEVYS